MHFLLIIGYTFHFQDGHVFIRGGSTIKHFGGYGRVTKVEQFNIAKFYNCTLSKNIYRVLQTKQPEIERNLNKYSVLGLASGNPERSLAMKEKVLLSTLEIGVIILGCIVFFGALATAICVLCYRHKKKRYEILSRDISVRLLSYTLSPIRNLNFSYYLFCTTSREELIV